MHMAACFSVHLSISFAPFIFTYKVVLKLASRLTAKNLINKDTKSLCWLRPAINMTTNISLYFIDLFYCIIIDMTNHQLSKRKVCLSGWLKRCIAHCLMMWVKTALDQSPWDFFFGCIFVFMSHDFSLELRYESYVFLLKLIRVLMLLSYYTWAHFKLVSFLLLYS